MGRGTTFHLILMLRTLVSWKHSFANICILCDCLYMAFWGGMTKMTIYLYRNFAGMDEASIFKTVIQIISRRNVHIIPFERIHVETICILVLI